MSIFDDFKSKIGAVAQALQAKTQAEANKSLGITKNIDPALETQLKQKGAAIYDPKGNLNLEASTQKLKEMNALKKGSTSIIPTKAPTFQERTATMPVASSGLPKATIEKPHVVLPSPFKESKISQVPKGEPYVTSLGTDTSTYDLSKYATDPKHEALISNIRSTIGKIKDPNQIDSYIQSKFPGSKITGQMVSNTAKKYNVPEDLLMALMQQDSQYGTSGIGSRNFNPGNIGQYDELEITPTKGYKSWEEGVDAIGKWLSKKQLTSDPALGLSQDVKAQQTIKESISKAQPWEKPVSINLPFTSKPLQTEAVPSQAKRFLAENLKYIIESPEKIANTMADFWNVRTSLIKKGSLDDAYRQIKSLDPEDESKVTSYAQDLKYLLNSDDYLSRHPVEAFSLLASQGILDIAGTGAILRNSIQKQIARLPSELSEVTNARLKLGLQLDSELSALDVKNAYNKVARITHPDMPGGNAAKFAEATEAKKLLDSKLISGNIPAVSRFNQNYGNILRKVESDISTWFKTPEKAPYLGVKGLLTEKAGMKPTQPFQPKRQPAVGLTTREVKEVPNIIPEKKITPTTGKTYKTKLIRYAEPGRELTDTFRGGTWYATPESNTFDFTKEFKNQVGGTKKIEQEVELKAPLVIKNASLEDGSFAVINNGYENYLPSLQRDLAEKLYKTMRSEVGELTDKEFNKAVENILLANKNTTQQIKQVLDSTNKFDSAMDLIISKGLKSVGYDGLILENEYKGKVIDRHIFKIPEETVKTTPVTTAQPKVSPKTAIIPKRIKPPTIKQRITAVTEKKIPEVKINTTEKSLLLKKFRDIKAGAQTAKKIEQKVAQRQSSAYKRQILNVAKTTRKEERTKIIDLFKKKISDVNEIKDSIVKYTKDNISLSNRGKIIDAIKNAKTKGDLANAMQRVDFINRYEKSKEIISSIKEATKEMDQLPIDVKKKINEFLSEFKFSTSKNEKIKELLKSKEWMKAGHDLPNRIKMQIEMLEKTNLRDLPIDKLESIKAKLDVLINEGKTKMRVKKEIEDLRYEAKIKELKDAGVNLDVEVQLRKPGRPSGVDWKNEKKSQIANLVQSGDWELTFMDRFFDMLDGNKHYQGKIYDTFYNSVKRANDLYLREEHNISKELSKLQRSLNFNVYDYERIGMYAILQQKNGLEKLLANGYDSKMISQIRLNDRQMKMYEFMRNKMEEMHPRINKVMEEEYNESLGYIENYFPFQTDFDQQAPVLEQLKKMYRRTTPEKGFTKQRTQMVTPVKIDAGYLFKNYMRNSLRFIHMDKTLKNIGKIANDSEFGDIVGKKAQKYVQQWIDVQSRNGGITDHWNIPILNTMRRNLGVSMLGFKLSSALYQPLAKFNGAAELGAHAFKYDNEFITKSEIRKFILDSSSEMAVRIGDDPGYVDLSENPTIKDIQQKAMWALQKLDYLTAGSIWYGAYRKRLGELGKTFDINNVNQEALDYADRVVRLTQASPLYKDLPPAFVGKQRDLMKTLFTFQTFMLNDWNYIKHDLVKLGIADSKDIALMSDPKAKSEAQRQLINRMSTQLLFLIASGVGVEAVQSQMSELWYGKDYQSIPGHLISSIINRIPGLSQMYSLLEYESLPAPLFGTIQNFGKGVNQLFTAKSKMSKFKGGVKAAESIGQVFGIPGASQISQILKGPISRIIDSTKKPKKNPYGINKGSIIPVKAGDNPYGIKKK